MNKQTTALQTLVDHLENCSKQLICFAGMHSVEDQKGVRRCLAETLEYIKRTELLNKEREQIEKAYEKGCEEEYPKPLPQTGWIYYNDTFITN